MAQTQSRVDEGQIEQVDRAIHHAQQYLLDIQYPQGYWWGELESNSTMEAEYLLLTYFLDIVDQERWRKLCNFILSRQREDGSWGQYYQAPGNISTSVECYFALKLAGIPPDAPQMQKARHFILSKGGIPKVRVFTKIWLAIFGQWDWKGSPAMPPELMFLPNWSPLNIYDFSSWARATIVPMLIILTKKPVRPVPPWASIDDLFPNGRKNTDHSVAKPGKLLSWTTFFNVGDRLVRLYEHIPWKPGRQHAIGSAEKWILSHQEADGSWAGIQPPWVYSLIALKTLGYPSDHPVIKKGLEGFEGFAIEDRNTWRVQACVSPVWDTALVLIGLMDSDMEPSESAIEKSVRWLLKQQIFVGGDWQVKAPKTPSGGWAFEFHNNIYPDIDDTAEIVIALQAARLNGEAGQQTREAIQGGVTWLLGMQSKNGGWAAFDKDNTKTITTKIPFCDFGETLDPPSVDVTAHVVEALGKLGYTKKFPPVQLALQYILEEQEPDGPWFGRWGVNYIYGTGAVLPALEAIGEDLQQAYVQKALEWLIEHQNQDGGWGESCGSYVVPTLRGRGPSTASQTAWALMALIAAGKVEHYATQRGVQYLVHTQQEEGSWDEPYFTGTGFPGYCVGQRLKRLPSPGECEYQGLELPAAFMINYHIYRNCWPLTALGRYMRKLNEK